MPATPTPAPAPEKKGPTDDEIFAKRPFEFALGRAAMNFGALEYSLLCGIAELVPFVPGLNLDNKLETSFGPALKRYDGLVKALVQEPGILIQHDAVMTDLRKLGVNRNTLIHGAWFDAPGHNPDTEKAKVRRHTTIRDLVSPGHAADFIQPLQIVDWFNKVYRERRAFDVHRRMVIEHIHTTRNAAQGVP